MDKGEQLPPTYGFVMQPPPTYEQAIGQHPIGANISTTNTAEHRNVQVITRVVTHVATLGPHSTLMSCPSCHADVNTKVRSAPGVIAWVSGFLIAFFGCWLGCCLIPCCIDECMDTHHFCPNCNTYLGRYGNNTIA